MSYLPAGDTAPRTTDEAWAAASSRLTVILSSVALLGVVGHLFFPNLIKGRRS
jgi:hypothetical protein